LPPNGFLSGDGESLFFDSAVDLDAGHRDVWVLDIADGTTLEVSTSAAGESGNAHSNFVGASANGRFVAIRSGASNLVDGDDEGSFDLFVKDRLTGEIVLVAEGGPVGNLQVGSISADGSAVAYAARGDNGEYQIFWAPTGFEGGDVGVEGAGFDALGLGLDQLLIDQPDVA
jgi:Tol biopolymer transport system component